jgi:hypothetical protein
LNLRLIILAGTGVSLALVVAMEMVGRSLWTPLPGMDYLVIDFMVMAFQRGMPAQAAWLAGTAMVLGPFLGASIPARALDGWDRWIGGVLAGAIVPIGYVMYASKRDLLTMPMVAVAALGVAATLAAAWLATRPARRAPYDEFR